MLTVIARTRIDAGKLLAVRRALCASEYGGVIRIRVWCPEDGDSSSQRTKIRLTGPNGEDQPPLAPRGVADLLVPADRAGGPRAAGLSPLTHCTRPRMGGTTSTTQAVALLMTGLIRRRLARNRWGEEA